MASADTPGRDASRVRDLELSPGQRALLDEFSRKAGAPVLDRPFAVTGSPPHRRLVRKNIVIETALSNADLAQLARAGYLEYRPQENSVAFRAEAYDRQLQIEALPVGRVGAKGFRLRRVAVPFGRHPVLTVIRPFLVVAAVALVLLWVVGVLSSAAVSVLLAAGVLLAAALALRIPQ
jgi:hypothetical protein